MQRREFIAFLGSALAAWPLTAQAQAPDRVRYIAWLGLGHAGTPSPYLDSLRTGLRELGWVEGRNLKIVAFWATGREETIVTDMGNTKSQARDFSKPPLQFAGYDVATGW